MKHATTYRDSNSEPLSVEPFNPLANTYEVNIVVPLHIFDKILKRLKENVYISYPGYNPLIYLLGTYK